MKKRKKKIHKSSLHLLKYKHFPYHKKNYANSPSMYMTTLISKLLPPFVMSDKE